MNSPKSSEGRSLGRQLYHFLSRIPNYVRAFGFIAGTRLLWQIELVSSRRSTEERDYSVPTYSQRLALRKNIGDHSTFWQCIVTQQYALSRFTQYRLLRQKYEVMRQRGEKILILDGGGNVGLGAVWFAEQFPAATIVSVEPDSENIRILKKNTEIYGDRVIALQGALWHRDAHVRITNPGAGSASFEVEECGSSEGVPGFTVASIITMVAADAVFIAKLDIEGSQKHLFGRNTEWVSECELIIMELEDWKFPWGGTSTAFFKCLSCFSFDYLIEGENIFCFHHDDATRGRLQ